MPDLPSEFFANERGNTWLTNGDGDHYALIKLGGNRYLEISIVLANYPGLNVATIEADEASLAQRITDKFGDWIARKVNIPGVGVDEAGNVVGNEE